LLKVPLSIAQPGSASRFSSIEGQAALPVVTRSVQLRGAPHGSGLPPKSTAIVAS